MYANRAIDGLIVKCSKMFKAVLLTAAVAFGLNAAAVVDVVKDCGAKGDGVTDDTAAIQRAIDLTAKRGGGKIFFPYTTNGYLVASPAKEFADNGRLVRSQLVLPPGKAAIQFEGEFPAKMLYAYQVRPLASVKNGFSPTKFGTMGMNNVCLRSTWEAPEVRDPEERPWSVIAAPEGDSCAGKFSRAFAAMKNLEIRVHLNEEKMYPTTSAAFLKNVSRLVIEDCQFCLDENVGDTELGKHLVENPCHTVGLHASGDQNDQQILRDVAVQGFKYGFVFGEHVVADHLYVHNCEQAVVFHDATHLSKIGMLVAQHNRTILAKTEGVWREAFELQLLTLDEIESAVDGKMFPLPYARAAKFLSREQPQASAAHSAAMIWGYFPQQQGENK